MKEADPSSRGGGCLWSCGFESRGGGGCLLHVYLMSTVKLNYTRQAMYVWRNTEVRLRIIIPAEKR
jgi:hypothetical protein